MNHPTPLPPESQVRYVDRVPLEELRKHYPESEVGLVPVDIVDEIETLATLPDSSEDFVIAAQCIEHCQNPIRALVNMLRVVRPEKFIVLTVPDRRLTFDRDRPNTTNEHLFEECKSGTQATARTHYLEFVTLVEKVQDPLEADKRVAELMTQDYAIHFHAWDSDAFLGMLIFVKQRFQLPMEIWAAMRNGEELIVVLRKMAL